MFIQFGGVRLVEVNIHCVCYEVLISIQSQLQSPEPVAASSKQTSCNKDSGTLFKG